MAGTIFVFPEENSISWRKLIERANADFRVGRLKRAERLYARAAEQLDRDLEGKPMSAALLLARAITLQNRATTLVALGESSRAASIYKGLHAQLRSIVLDSQEVPQLRAIAMRQCRITAQELSACLAHHGEQLTERVLH